MELSVIDVMRVLRRYGWIVAMLVLVGGSLGYLAMAEKEEVYTAKSLVMLLPGQSAHDTPFNRYRTSQGYLQTYSTLMTSRPIVQRVQERLEGDYTIAELESRIRAFVLPDTMLIEVEVQHDDAEQAALLANAVVEEFEIYLAGLLDEDEPPAEVAVPVEVIEPAVEPTALARPRTAFGMLFGGLVGLIAGIALLAAVVFWRGA